MTAGILIEDLTVVRGGRALVSKAGFAVEKGSIGAILGPSGAGKSTILRAIAGLVTPDSGTITLDGVRVHSAQGSMPPEQRNVGMLFQGLALWSHMTALGHLRFALEGRKVPRGEWDTRIREVTEVLGIGPLADRRPPSLSGGERQRLALARALVTRPAALLLDEPTASVDPSAARDVRTYVQQLNARFAITTLLVTHDQDEALSLARSVLVLDRGESLQAGAPAEIYAQPNSIRVARFLGEGVLVPATVRGGGAAETPIGAVSVAGGTAPGRGSVLVRPEALVVSQGGDGVPCLVVSESFRGPTFRLVLRVGDQELMADARSSIAPGSQARLRYSGLAPFFPEGSP